MDPTPKSADEQLDALILNRTATRAFRARTRAREHGLSGQDWQVVVHPDTAAAMRRHTGATRLHLWGMPVVTDDVERDTVRLRYEVEA